MQASSQSSERLKGRHFQREKVRLKNQEVDYFLHLGR